MSFQTRMTFTSVEHQKRIFEEHPGCSVPYNESERRLGFSKFYFILICRFGDEETFLKEIVHQKIKIPL